MQPMVDGLSTIPYPIPNDNNN